MSHKPVMPGGKRKERWGGVQGVEEVEGVGGARRKSFPTTALERKETFQCFMNFLFPLII